MAMDYWFSVVTASVTYSMSVHMLSRLCLLDVEINCHLSVSLGILSSSEDLRYCQEISNKIVPFDLVRDHIGLGKPVGFKATPT